MYAHMLPRKDCMLEFNDVGVPRWEDALMRRLWPSSRAGAPASSGRATRSSGPPARARRLRRDRERLEDGRPYLFGERFTAADLTFAALAAAVSSPPEYGTPLPQLDVLPEPVARDVAAFRAHPQARSRCGCSASSAGRGRLISIVGAMPDVLRPLFDQVVIKELEPDRMRKSGLLVPQGTPTCRPTRASSLAAATGRRTCPTSRCRSSPATTSCSRAARACGSRSRTSGCSSAASARSSA
jgi:hypothetical protein